MSLFIRFTENIEKDIELGTSILTSSNSEIADGLCAFGPFENEQESQKCVTFWQKFYPEEHEHYALVEATEVMFAKRGSLGTIIKDLKIIRVI